MNRKNMLWAALSMTAALVMTACTSEDNSIETPAAQQATVTIPYTVTVGQGDAATTRATVESDMKTLYFADGDKLYITGTNVKGVLNIQDGAGTATATFSGDLTVTGDTPADDLALTATLVGAQQTVGTEVSVDDEGAVTVNYPTNAYCADVATAVQKYSRLTGTSTYGAKSFSLSQQTAFLNFVITFEDGTATGTDLSAVVSNGGSALCTANVTTATESEKVVAKFVLPVAAGTALSSATVKMDDKEAISFGASQTLEGKVYNVKKTQAAAGISAASAAGTTGTYKDANNVEREGIVVTLGGNKYLIATANETDLSGTTSDTNTKTEGSYTYYSWANAKSKFANNKDSYSDANVWRLPTKDELTALVGLSSKGWDGTNKGYNWTIGSASLSASLFLPAAGICDNGTAKYVDYGYYWSSTPHDNVNNAYMLFFGSGSAGCYVHSDSRVYGFTVRLVCLLSSE